MNKKPKRQKAKKPKGRLPFLLLSALCFLLFFLGCKQSTDNNKTTPVVQAQLLEGSVYLPANASDWFTYRILVTDSRYYPDSIVCEVFRPNGDTLSAFGLYDDGGLTAHSHPNYASSTSQDIAARDGQFTRQINPALMADSITGNYEFHFHFYGSANYQMGNDNRLTVSVQNAGDCLITSYPHDSAFAECFGPDTLFLRVLPTQADRVDSVRMSMLEGTNMLNRAEFAALSGDTVWRLVLDPTFFRCAGTAQNAYTLKYTVKTRFGMACSTEVAVIDFTNDLPTVSDPSLPDTILRPMSAQDTNRIVMTVRLHDCEYLSNRDYNDFIVRYDVRKETVTQWDDSPRYVMFDNADAPDGHPFDGTFAGGLTIVHSDTIPNRLYYFRFSAIDCAPPYDTSAFVLDSVRLIQPVPGAPISAHGITRPMTGAEL